MIHLGDPIKFGFGSITIRAEVIDVSGITISEVPVYETAPVVTADELHAIAAALVKHTLALIPKERFTGFGVVNAAIRELYGNRLYSVTVDHAPLVDKAGRPLAGTAKEQPQFARVLAISFKSALTHVSRELLNRIFQKEGADLSQQGAQVVSAFLLTQPPDAESSGE